jgi:inositol-pentakisphosphate 2-kinase
MDNLTFSNNQHGVAFEMKPKWGFFPANYTQSCRFCLHNAVKTNEGEEKSEFCPMELFSGDQAIMLNCFKTLFKTPKNNLRLFKAGSMVPLGEVASPHLDLYMKILSNLLADSSVLRSLKKHQESFHDDIFQLKPFEHLGKTIDTKEYMNKVLLDVWENQENNLERRIARLLLSLSMKDLSLFITILPRDSSFDMNQFIGKKFLIEWGDEAEGVIMFDNKPVFDFKIKLVDVDIKKIEKMDKWFNLEKELTLFQEQHSNLKVCNRY